MKTLLAQLNPVVGDLRGNTRRIIEIIGAHRFSHDLIVFPELCITGYPPNDLLLRRGFVEEQLDCLEQIRRATVGVFPYVLVGAVTKNMGIGKPLHNSAIGFRNGERDFIYHKQLLPTYNIFDEARYFEAGATNKDGGAAGWQSNLITISGRKYGVLICEDCWNDEAICDAPLYPTNPVRNTFEHGSGLVFGIITLNASPSDIGKHHLRYDMYSKLSKKYKVPFIYVNQVGAQDSLVFDGHSFMANGGDIYYAHGFSEHSYSVSFESSKNVVINTPKSDRNELVFEHLKLGLRDYISKNGFKGVVVGSSGGIDSAVVLAIAKETIGAENVTAITMPSKYSSIGSVNDSIDLCDKLGVTLYNHSIADETVAAIDGFKKTFGQEPKRIVIENLQARIRMRILMEFSNQTGALVLNTTNKSEASVGYGTLFGDVSGGLAVIADLYKMEVYELAKWYNNSMQEDIIPKAIINKEPSAELWEGQRDSDSLPPYPILDAILKLYLERDLMAREDIELCKKAIEPLTISEIKRVLKLVDGAEYKRKMSPPAIRIHRRSFGQGRFMPITQRHEVSIENLL